MAVIKILENGVRLCLKLQTSHIASMYFESWLDKKKKNDYLILQFISGEDNCDQKTWIQTIADFTEKEQRSYLDLVTLSCILLAAKLNE